MHTEPVCQPDATRPPKCERAAATSSRWNGCGSKAWANVLISFAVNVWLPSAVLSPTRMSSRNFMPVRPALRVGWATALEDRGDELGLERVCPPYNASCACLAAAEEIDVLLNHHHLARLVDELEAESHQPPLRPAAERARFQNGPPHRQAIARPHGFQPAHLVHTGRADRG